VSPSDTLNTPLAADGVCLYFCVFFLQRTKVISLYSCSLLVSTTGAKCVYCAVRTVNAYQDISFN